MRFGYLQEGEQLHHPTVERFPQVGQAVKTWFDYQDSQKILLTTPTVLVGYRVEVYRVEGTTQWYTAVIQSYNHATKVRYYCQGRVCTHMVSWHIAITRGMNTNCLHTSKWYLLFITRVGYIKESVFMVEGWSSPYIFLIELIELSSASFDGKGLVP